jgi:hypothetical protein
MTIVAVFPRRSILGVTFSSIVASPLMAAKISACMINGPTQHARIGDMLAGIIRDLTTIPQQDI